MKKVLIGVVLVVVAAILFVVGVLMFGGPPMVSGSSFADGKVTLVVDHMGPVRIGAYIVSLTDGGVALVDAGMDPEARGILAALRGRRVRAVDVRAVFLTHAHDDHFGGVRAFPDAEVFALEPDAVGLRHSGLATHGLTDGERLTIAGTTIEVFAVPGHTAGSAAYLIEGVLFLGDAAASLSDTEVGPNDYAFTVDVEQNHRSLHALAQRLAPRRDEVRFLAFGHQGPVAGLEPLLAWAER